MTSIAAAQDGAPAPAAPPPPPPPAASDPAPAAAPAEDKPDAMNSFGFGPRIGVLGMKQRTAKVSSTGVATIEDGFEFGYVLSIPVQFGDGHGFFFDMDPYFAGIGDLNQLGVGFTFGGRFQIADPMYLSIGAGPRIAGIFFDGGGGVFGGFRAPIGFYYYLLNSLGLVGEIGIGYGGYGVGSVSGTANVSAEGTSGLTFDTTVGIRFP